MCGCVPCACNFAPPPAQVLENHTMEIKDLPHETLHGKLTLWSSCSVQPFFSHTYISQFGSVGLLHALTFTNILMQHHIFLFLLFIILTVFKQSLHAFASLCCVRVNCAKCGACLYLFFCVADFVVFALFWWVVLCPQWLLFVLVLCLSVFW